MPPATPVQILFVGDLHLGRRASRVPETVWRDHGLDPELLTPTAAWERCIDAARERGVTAVALAGDLVHQEDDVFEARGRLEDGIRRLAGAGIRVCAVAGNHDTRVLPVLAGEIAELELLGPGGTWTATEIAADVRLAGWSFPARHHAASPLRTPPPPPTPGVVTLGLLHADLDAPGSRYAPVGRDELAAVGYDGWVLGHIHVPDPVPGPGEARPFYLGSAAAITPNETGAHGPVLATVTAGAVRWERLPLAPLRWEHADIPLDDFTPTSGDVGADLRLHLAGRLSGLARGAVAGTGPDLLGLRLTLTGAQPAADAIARWAAAYERGAIVQREPDGPLVFVEKITAAVTVPVDLDRLAARDDPPGLLARRILALEAEDPATEELVAAARVAVGAETAADIADADLQRELAAVGRRALGALLAQRGEAGT